MGRNIKMIKGRTIFTAAMLLGAFLILSMVIDCKVAKSNNTEKESDEASLATDKIINIQLTKKNDTYEIRNLFISMGKYVYYSDFKELKDKFYNGRVVSSQNETLGYFGVKNNLAVTFCSDAPDQRGCREFTEGELTIQLPYFPNGKYADIYDPFGKKVLTIDLSSKATCNENDKCDRPIEDSENCPQDCKKNEPKLDPAVIQKAAAEQEAAQAEEKKLSFSDFGWWGIAILIILLAGGGIGYWVYRRNRDF